MPFFKKTDGPGDIRIQYCGNKKDGTGFKSAWKVVILKDDNKMPINVKNKMEADTKFYERFKGNKLFDDSKKGVNPSTNYKFGSYSYNQSNNPKTPDVYFHDYNLSNPEDSFCNPTGGKKHKTKKNKTSSKRNKTSSKRNKTSSKRNKKSKK